MPIVTLVAHGETTSNIAIDFPVTSVASTEVIVIHTSYHTASRPVAKIFGGSNLTPTQIAQPYIGTQRIDTYIQTGITGSGNITLDGDLDGIGWEYSIYRISGLINPTSYTITNTPWYLLNSVSGTMTQTPTTNYETVIPGQTVAPGQVALLMSATSVTSYSLPGSVANPGWITDHPPGSSGRSHAAAHYVPTTVGFTQVSTKTTLAGAYVGGTMIVFGDAAPIAQVIEVKNGTIASGSTSGSVTLDTAVVPNDYIAVVTAQGNNTTTHTLSGWGGTAVWSGSGTEETGNSPRLYYRATTGMTGASTITLTIDSTALGAAFSVFVIRGLGSFKGVTVSRGTDYGSWTSTAVEHIINPSYPVAPGQVALMMGYRGTSGSSAPSSPFPNNPVPKTGWVKSRGTAESVGGVSINLWNAYLNPTEPVAPGGSEPYDFTGSVVGGTHMWIIGEATYGPWKGTFGASATVNVPFTDLNPDDMLVAIYSKVSAGTAGVSGMGTWTPFHNYQVSATGTRLYVATMTGASGAGNITFTSDASSTTNQYTLYLFRGLQNRTIAASQATSWYATDGVVDGAVTTVAANNEKGVVGLRTGRGQKTIIAGVIEGTNSASFPSTPSPPLSSGRWMVDTPITNVVGQHAAGRVVPDAVAFARGSTKVGSGTSWQGSVALEVGAEILPYQPPYPYIVETKNFSLTGTATNPITLDTTLVASDIVVVMYYMLFVATGVVTATGMTFINVLGGSGNTTLRDNSWAMRAAIATGATGSKTINIDPGGSATAGAVYVLRGFPATTAPTLGNSRLTQVINSLYTSTFAKVKTTVTKAGPGQIVLNSGMIEGGAAQSRNIPYQPEPALGWSYDTGEGTIYTSAHDSISTYGTVSGGAMTAVDAYMGSSMLVFGQPQANGTVVETQSFSMPASSSIGYGLSTALVASDLVIVLSSMNNTDVAQMTYAMTGATQNLVFSDTLTASGARYRVMYFTGLTGGQNLNVVTGSGVSTNRTTVMVVRGLIGPIVPVVTSAGWNGTNTVANTDFGVTGTAGMSQLAVFLGGAAAGAGTVFPSNQAPADWVVLNNERDAGKQMSGYVLPSVAGTASNSFQTATAVAGGAVMVVFGQATGISLPFVGWGGSV